MNPSSSKSATSAPRRNTQNRRKRWLPWLGAVVLVGLIVVGFLPQPTPVETARVSRGTLRATVNEEGKTRVRQRYVVSAPVAGHLRRIPFKAGAEVEGGRTVLTVIDPVSPALLDARNRALAEARRDVAAANLEKAGAAHRFAASELERFRKLYAEKAVSVQELEPVQWREAAAAKDLAAAQSAWREAEAELLEFTPGGVGVTNSARAPIEVASPVSGRLLRVFEENTRVVGAGTPLVEVGDPTDLEVVIEVLSRDGAAIVPGAKVLLEQWGGSEALEGTVRFVEPAAFTKVSALGVEEQRVNVVADLVTPALQRRGLGDNFRVEARIVVWEAADVLKVPAGAVFRRGQNWAALVLADGRATLRRVQVGHSGGNELEVLDGLRSGDEVILYPGERVRERQRVKAITISP